MGRDADQEERCRLVAVTIDESSIGRANRDVEHERAVAIYDLLQDNSFAPIGHEGGPYALHLAVVANRLYILPHQASRDSIRRRFERIDRTFDEQAAEGWTH